MNFLKNPVVLIIAIVISVVIAYLANSGNVFGKLISKFLPCEQNPTTSFPCYGGYDIAIMIIATIVTVVCVFLLISIRNKL